MNKTINLNADLGESFGAWSMGDDESLLDIVASANIACGFHAGDPLVMRRTVAAAKKRGVSIGAHPAFPDLQGFGRRRMDIPATELEAMIIYQIGALQAMDPPKVAVSVTSSRMAPSTTWPVPIRRWPTALPVPSMPSARN